MLRKLIALPVLVTLGLMLPLIYASAWLTEAIGDLEVASFVFVNHLAAAPRCIARSCSSSLPHAGANKSDRE